MTDLFAAYGETKAPQRKAPKEAKPPSALDLKLQEKQRLSRSYRALKVKENRAIMATEPRLAAFARFVKRAASANELVEAVQESWLPLAPCDVRFMALRIVAARCDRLNRAAGFAALDDPLPPETSCFFRVRAALGVR